VIVDAADDDGALDRLAGDWRALYDAAPAATPFQSWEWARAWWTHRRRGRLIVLCARDDSGALVGLLPLVLARVGPSRRMTLLGAPEADYQELLALPAYAAPVCVAFARWLASAARAWDVIDLPDVREDSALATLAPPSPGLAARRYPHRVCPYLPLARDGERNGDGDWRRAAGKQLRARLGRKGRKLARDFDVTFDLAAAHDLPHALDDLFWLHDRRWRRRGLPGAFARPSVRRFHRELAARFCARGWLKLHRLRVDGKTRAAFYCFADGARVYYYLSGFDLELGRYSPGALLMARAVDDAQASGARVFDLLRGDENYKREWGACERRTVRVVVTKRRDPRSWLAAAAITVERVAAVAGSRLRNRLWGHRRA
jgi:CelD/BcsL family acetyltransferase involved in cellulose biosynthesis